MIRFRQPSAVILQTEQGKLADALDDVAGAAKFGTTSLLDGTYAAKTFQVGADNGDTLSFSIDGISTGTLVSLRRVT